MVVQELIGKLGFQVKGLDQVKAAEKASADLKKTLNGLAGGLRLSFSGPAAAADKLSRSLKAAAEAARVAQAAQAKLGSGASFAKADAGAQKHIGTVNRLAAAYKDAARNAAALGGVPRGKSWAQTEIGHLRAYAALQRQVVADARRMGATGASPRLPPPARPLRYGASVPSVGAPLAGHGYQARNLAGQAFDEAATTPQIKALLRARTANETDPEKIAANEAMIVRAEKEAGKLSKATPEFSQAQHLQGIFQTMSVVGNLEKAVELYPMIAEYNAVIENFADKFNHLKPYTGGAATKDFARIFGSKGVTDDPQKMKSLGDAVLKGAQASSGDINPSDYLMSLKYLRIAKYGVSDDFIANYLPGLIEDVKVKSGGSSSAGTGLASLYDQFYNLRATNQAKEEMERTGVTTGKFQRNDKGKIIGRGTAELRNKEFRKNPQTWMNETLEPIIRERAKLGPDVKNDSDAFIAATQDRLGRLTSNRNAADTAGSMLIQREERERDARISRTMPGTDALPIIRRDSPVNTQQQVAAATKNLGADATEPFVAPLQWIGKKYAEYSGKFREWRDENPVEGSVTGVGAVGAGAYAAWKAGQAATRYGLSKAAQATAPFIAEAIKSAPSAETLVTKAAPMAQAAAPAAKAVEVAAVKAAPVAEAAAVATKAAPAVGLADDAVKGTSLLTKTAGALAKAAKFLGPAGAAIGIADAVKDLNERTAPNAGLDSGERMRRRRGGSVNDQLRRDFDEERERLGVRPLGAVEPPAPIPPAVASAQSPPAVTPPAIAAPAPLAPTVQPPSPAALKSEGGVAPTPSIDLGDVDRQREKLVALKTELEGLNTQITTMQGTSFDGVPSLDTTEFKARAAEITVTIEALQASIAALSTAPAAVALPTPDRAAGPATPAPAAAPPTPAPAAVTAPATPSRASVPAPVAPVAPSPSPPVVSAPIEKRISLEGGSQVQTILADIDAKSQKLREPIVARITLGGGEALQAALAGIQRGGDSAVASLSRLNTTVSPSVDSSSIDAFIGKINQAEAALKRLGSVRASVGSSGVSGAALTKGSNASTGGMTSP